ncbi:hypothetical protein ACFL16_03070 [Patescibacteria group bacterium]
MKKVLLAVLMVFGLVSFSYAEAIYSLPQDGVPTGDKIWIGGVCHVNYQVAVSPYGNYPVVKKEVTLGWQEYYWQEEHIKLYGVENGTVVISHRAGGDCTEIVEQRYYVSEVENIPLLTGTQQFSLPGDEVVQKARVANGQCWTEFVLGSVTEKLMVTDENGCLYNHVNDDNGVISIMTPGCGEHVITKNFDVGSDLVVKYCNDAPFYLLNSAIN